jgi:hypothetical protein
MYIKRLQRTQHLQSLQCSHAKDEIPFGKVEDLYVFCNVSDDGLGFGGLLAYARHLTEQFLQKWREVFGRNQADVRWAHARTNIISWIACILLGSWSRISSS